MMLKIVRTDSNNKDFSHLVKALDAYLKITDGDEHEFYNQFNNINVLKHVVIIYANDKAIGCGAFKPFNVHSVEIKRMYTSPEYRGQGIASKVLVAIEDWAKELDYKNCVLETGKRQTEAVEFYTKCGYAVISSYGQYRDMENSLCFNKKLK